MNNFALVAASFLFALVAAADENTPPPNPFESEYSRTIDEALKPILNTYGPDAVNLQGLLLKHSLDAGSQLEASARIDGISTLDEQRVLDLTIDSGIVFLEPNSAVENVRWLWANVIQPALIQCKTMNVEATRISMNVLFRSARFRSRAELLAKSASLPAQSVRFDVNVTDLLEHSSAALSIAGLAGRVRATLDNEVIALVGAVPASR